MRHTPTWILHRCGMGEMLCKTIGTNHAGNPLIALSGPYP